VGFLLGYAVSSVMFMLAILERFEKLKESFEELKQIFINSSI